MRIRALVPAVAGLVLALGGAARAALERERCALTGVAVIASKKCTNGGRVNFTRLMRDWSERSTCRSFSERKPDKLRVATFLSSGAISEIARTRYDVLVTHAG